jgi:hypothetical protein
MTAAGLGGFFRIDSRQTRAARLLFATGGYVAVDYIEARRLEALAFRLRLQS